MKALTSAMFRRRSALLVAVAVALVALDSAARPGGGHTYSGGGHSSSGGGGGGGGGSGGDGGIIFFFIRILLELCISAPAIGIPLVLALVVGGIVMASRANSNRDWNGPSEAAVVASRSESRPRAPKLDAIRARDPEFSSVLFEDFVYALFATAHRARHDAKKFAELAPYLEDGARSALTELAPQAPITAAVVGALRVAGVELDPDATEVTLEFEANLIFAGAGTQYVVERWLLRRDANVKSRASGTARTFACPNCGAPFESTDSQRCRYCNEVVSNGRFDWSVADIDVLEASARPPSLTGSVPEEGTDLRTISDSGFRSAWTRLQTEDPALSEPALAARIALIHHDLTAAWNTLDLAPVRGFVSDGLFDYLGYWTEAYRAQGLRNVVEGATIQRWEPVKLGRDLHYDALTVRLFATGKDFTLDGHGKVVGGSRDRDRAYSEYWTLIRGAKTRGTPSAQRACPSCGAELRIEMSGECAFCHVRVTAGQFDWVLSKIEQDDSYAG